MPSYISRRNNLALGIEAGGLGPESNREIIDFGRVEHPPAQLRRLTQRDRQHPRRERVERPAMADLDLAQPRLAAHALHRADRLRRTESNGFVEYDPAVHPAPLGAPDGNCQFAAGFLPMMSFALSRDRKSPRLNSSH